MSEYWSLPTVASFRYLLLAKGIVIRTVDTVDELYSLWKNNVNMYYYGHNQNDWVPQELGIWGPLLLM